MAKNLVCAALLFALAAVNAHAQTVALRACNAGKADIDVYFAQGANVISKHVAPADCAELASSKGAMSPGAVAVGFTDTQGQYGGVHRYERLPTFRNGVAESSTQTLSVMHGATRVSIPAQFRFQPPAPVCVEYRRQTSTGIVDVTTRCDDFTPDINVLAFPDTREVAFLRFCQTCDDKVEAQKSTEQRAREKQLDDVARAVTDRIGPLPSTTGLVAPLGVEARMYVEANSPKEERKDRYLEMLERDPTKWDRIGWSDVPRYSYQVFENVAMRGSVAVLQGTITGMQRHSASDPWYHVFFQESLDHKFLLCTQNPDVLADIFGANYSTAMVGKKIEVEGRVVDCMGAAGILLKLAHQIKLVGTGPGMVASATPPAFEFPEDPDKRVVYEPAAAGSAEYNAGQLARARERIGRQCQALYTPPVITALGHPPFEPDEALIKADTAACVEQFDLAKVVPQEQAAMRYCLAQHNYNAARPYTKEFDDVLSAWNECMAQNDPVTIPCETARRASLRPPALDPCPELPAPTQIAQMLRGDAGPVPQAPPGLPAIQLPPATAKAAAAKALAAAGLSPMGEPLNAPSAAPAQSRPAAAPASPPSAPASPQKAAATANSAVTRAEKTQACVQETMQKLGPNALSDLAAYQKTVQACMQR